MSTLPSDFNSLTLPQQNQILAWMQDLSTGQADQTGANQAVQGLAGYGAAPPANAQYSTFNGTNGLNYTPLPLPVASAPQLPSGNAITMNTAQPRVMTSDAANNQTTPTVDPSSTAQAFTRPLPTAGQPQPTAQGLQGAPTAGGAYPQAPAWQQPGMGMMSPATYNQSITAMMGSPLPAPTPGVQPISAPNPPASAGPTVQTAAGTTPISQLPTPYVTPGAPSATGGTPAPAGYNPVDQTAGLTYTSQPGNFPTGTPMVPNAFDPAFLQNYGAATSGALGAIGNAFQTAPWGTMNAAQMNPGGVPQVNAQTPQSFQALQFLLSGQGFDPATLARMNAQATDTVSQSAAGTMDAARLAAERAGLLNSGLGVGLQANVANQAGIQNQQALNNIAIANAQQGIQNLTQGAGMNLNLQENAAAQANQVALQNAANLFSSMTQNLANQQASNAANFAGQQQRALGQAQAQSGYAAGAGQNLQNSMTQQYYGANVNNANIANQQWGTSGGWLNNLANYGSPYGAVNANTSAAGATNANTTLGNTLTGYGAATTGTKPAGT